MTMQVMNLFKKLIPEWRPYFCRKCNKMGHDCKMGTIETQAHVKKMNNVEGNVRDDKQLWIPTSIAKVMQGVTTLTELRQKLTEESNPLCDKPAATVEEEHDEPRNCSDIGASSVLGSELATVAQLKEQDIGEREGWTPVAPSKVARRGQQLPPNRNRVARGFETQCD